MKDIILCLPVGVSLLAQIPQQDSWERLGIAGLSIGVTIFMWRYFITKEADAKKEHAEKEAEEKVERQKRETADTAERNRLLEVQNQLQKQVVDLLQKQAEQSAEVARVLVASQNVQVQAQKDFLKANEDGQRSIKELARKIPSAREVQATIVNDAEHPAKMTLVEDPAP